MAENSSSHQRAVKSYLKPKTDVLFRAYVEREELSESEAINMMVNHFFTHLTTQQRLSYLSRGKKKEE
jgi:hypothetical protein